VSTARREIAADETADAQSAADRLARAEAKKEKARKRAAKSYARRKAANKGSAAQKKSAPGADAAPAADPLPSSAPGLAGILDEAAAAAAEPPPTPEEAAARAALEQFGTAEKFAAFMARMQKVAEIAVSKSARGLKVVKALDWAEADGAATANCKMGVELAWPWLEQGGFEFLALLGPGFMAALGGAMLFGPAVIVALDEYEQHKLERLQKAAELSKDAGGAGVSELRAVPKTEAN
jgi:hypothetical protein